MAASHEHGTGGFAVRAAEFAYLCSRDLAPVTW
jgi:hypothetical protein